MTQTLRALRIGATAGTLLRPAGARWKVLAAVDGALYIENRNGALLWITDRPSALHPRAVLVPAMPAHAPPVGSVLRDANGVLCCDRFAVAWQGAALWAPGGGSATDRVAAGFPKRVARAVRQAVVLDGRRTCTGRAMAWGTNDERAYLTEGAACAIEVELARYAEILSLAATGRDVLSAVRAAAGLIGLGEGLTPAGDDILGGYLYTLRTLNDAGCLRSIIDWECVTAWLRSMAHLTNAISHCLLVDHAEGDACAPLVEFVSESIEGSADARLGQLAGVVAGIGASSGQRLLLGMRTACHVVGASSGCSRRRPAGRASVAVDRSWRREVARVR